MSITGRDVFTAVADPIRRRILELLAGDDLPVNRLCDRFEVSRPAVSRHLRVLRDAGLVTEFKIGRERLYALNPGPLQAVRMWIAHFDRFWDVRLRSLKPRRETGVPEMR